MNMMIPIKCTVQLGAIYLEGALLAYIRERCSSMVVIRGLTGSDLDISNRLSEEDAVNVLETVAAAAEDNKLNGFWLGSSSKSLLRSLMFSMDWDVPGGAL